MHRFFSEDGASIRGEELKHLRQVLRLAPGDEIEVLWDGRRLLAELTEVAAQAAAFAVRQELPDREPRCRVTLFQALPKAGKLETIVQKCVELGVDTVVPVLASRCVAVPARDFSARLQRLRRVAEEAAKQSRRGVIPQVEAVRPLASLALDGFDAALLAYECERETTLKAALRARSFVAEAGDARSLLEKLAPVLIFGGDNGIYLALTYKRIAVRAEAGVHKQLVHIAQPYKLAVYFIFALAASVISAGNGDNIALVFKGFIGIIKREAHLREADGLSYRGAAEDDILHP